jgi:hypothetical protein
LYKRRSIKQCFNVIFKSQIGDTALGGMRHGTAQFFGGDFFVRHGFHHFRASHEHVGLLSFTMKMKSVMAGEYTAPPADGPMIMLICGIDAAGHHVALEHVGIAAQ